MTTTLPPGGQAPPDRAGSPRLTGLERILGAMSVFTMLMTIPQVTTIWIGHDARGVSLVSWGTYLLSACLWFVHGVRRRDRTIWIACVGWIALDVAIVVGAVVHG